MADPYLTLADLPDWAEVEAALDPLNHIPKGAIALAGATYESWCRPGMPRVRGKGDWKKPRCSACDAAWKPVLPKVP